MSEPTIVSNGRTDLETNGKGNIEKRGGVQSFFLNLGRAREFFFSAIGKFLFFSL